jgi:RNA polymerase sigma-70 factor (ECF subfamily)
MGKNIKKKFIKLYDTQHAAVYRFLRLKVTSDETAQDLTSETFTKAWSAIVSDKKGYPQNDRAFLYRVARNILIDYYRSASRQKEFSMGSNAEAAQLASAPGVYAEDAREQIITRLDLTQNMSGIYAALLRLPPETAEIIAMRYIEDLSNADIAEILNKTEGSVRTTLSRGLKQLKEEITIS